jgi:hypothetical protein
MPTYPAITTTPNLGLDTTGNNPTDAQNFFTIDSAIPSAALNGSKLYYVDGNRTDTYTANGSIALPFKTIMAAVSQIIANGDNTATVPYAVRINPGTYAENVNVSDPACQKIAFISTAGSSDRDSQTEAQVLITGSGGAVFTCSGNANMSSILFSGIRFLDPGGTFTFNANATVTMVGCYMKNSINVSITTGTWDCMACSLWTGTITLANSAIFETFYSELRGSGNVLTASSGCIIQHEQGSIQESSITIPSGVTLNMFGGSRTSSTATVTIQSGATLQGRNAQFGVLTVNGGGTANLYDCVVFGTITGTLAPQGTGIVSKVILGAAAPTVAAGQVGLGATTATTATGGAQTLPGNPAGFLIINVAGTVQKIPYYNT